MPEKIKTQTSFESSSPLLKSPENIDENRLLQLLKEERLAIWVRQNTIIEIRKAAKEDPDLFEHEYPQYDNWNIFTLSCNDKYGMDKTSAETIQVLKEVMKDKFSKPSSSDHWEAIHYTAINANKVKMKAVLEKISSEEVNSLVFCSNKVLKKFPFVSSFEKTFSNNALHILLKYGKRSDDGQFQECFKLLIENGIDVHQKDSDDQSPLDLMDADLRNLYETLDIGSKKLVRSDSKNFRNFDGPSKEYSSCTKLQLYSFKGSKELVRYVLKKGASVDETIPKFPVAPLKIALEEDHEDIVKLLLARKTNVPGTILLDLQIMHNEDVATCAKYIEIILKHLEESGKEVRPYLLALDENQRTPLHYACSQNNFEVAKMLFLRGAPLTKKDIFDDTPLDSIEPQILEKLLDSCAEKSNSFKCLQNKSHSCIKINYKFLIAGDENQTKKESLFLEHIIKENKLLSLLTHPVLLLLLMLKWRKLQKYLYMDLVLYLLAYFFLVIYGAKVAASGLEGRPSSVVLYFPLFVSLFRLIVYLSLFKTHYMKQFDFYLSILLIGAIFYIVAAEWVSYFVNRNLLVCYSVILLSSTAGSFFQLRHFSFFTINIIMFEQITINFLKYMALYIFPILAFTLSFFLLYDQQNKSKFFFPMVFETMAMFSGDPDKQFPETHFATNPIFGHCIYLIFIVLIGIILHNLLTALAIDDLQKIQKQADFIDKKERAQYILDVEKIADESSILGFIRPWFAVFTDNYQVVLCCHQPDYIHFETLDKKSNLDDCVINFDNLPCCYARIMNKDRNGNDIARDKRLTESLCQLYKNISLKNKEGENTMETLIEKMKRIEEFMKQMEEIQKKRSRIRKTVL